MAILDNADQSAVSQQQLGYLFVGGLLIDMAVSLYLVTGYVCELLIYLVL